MKRFRPLLLLLALIATNAMAAGDCTPSRWGPDDQIGSANLVTPERVAAAARLVKKGETLPLGIVIDSETPAFSPRGLSLQVISPGQTDGKGLFGYGGIYNDDLAQLWFGIGSQLDGLGHMGQHGFYYNCNSAAEISQISGLTRLGVHNVPPLVGRAVVIDIAKHRAVEHLDAGDAIGAEEIRAAAKMQELTLGEGDIILLHTGWTDAKLNSDPNAWVSAQPGIDNGAAEYLAGLNPLAVGADTWGLGAVPPKDGEKLFYEHVILLKHNGIYILETMNTGALLDRGVQEFMFVLGQARIRGAVQMMINPVAMW